MTRAVRDRILKDVNGDISDHLRNHIHLTNCIHLKNHMHKSSPIMADRTLMRELVALQRSRSLRDPTASPRSWHSPSGVDVLLRRGETDEFISGSRSGGIEQRRMSVSSPMGRHNEDAVPAVSVSERRRGKRPESSEKFPDVHRNGEYPQDGDDFVGAHISGNSGSRESYRQDGQLRTLSDQLNDRVLAESDDAASSHNHGNGRHSQMERIAEEAGINIRHRSSLNRGKRRRFRGARRSRPSIATRDAEAQNDMSVASNSFGQCGKHPMEEAEQENYDHNVSGVPKNGCGIPWNWSRIHDRGKSFLDLAGRSLSCGLSDPRLRKGGLNSRGMDMADMRVMSSSSSTKSDGEALPLLLDGSQGSNDRAAWLHDYSGELGIYAGNLLKQETDSDLASEGRSGEQHRFGKGKHRNERHQNLTQKYIPRTFRDLVGQNLVVQALSNAIIKRKVGLLYLFYGPHGTGKTSCARIFARALNCQSLEEPKPCGYCNSCVAQSKGKVRNVTEIGPVSNIDSESILRLLDRVTTSQHQSQFRVFIFDECDSVSSECWSAILKFIDRAPRRIVFVLVCSSLDALPHVVITRCQKFFFPKLKDADIIYTLQWISSKEDIEIDKDALKLIASKSDGSLRDAEMTLEQLSLLGKRVSVGLVQELVGLVSDEKLVDLLDLALSADTVNTVKNLRDIMESGVEPLALMSQLATVITDILAGSYDFMKGRPRRKFFRRQELSKEDMEKLRQALKTLSEAEKQLRVSNDKITWLTAALLQLAPDQHYMLPTSSGDTSSNHSPLALNNASIRQRPRKSNAEMPTPQAGSSGNVHNNGKLKGMDGNEHDGGGMSSQLVQINDKSQMNKDRLRSIPHEEIWLAVLRKIPINSVREFMYQEGKLISINYGAAPTVQLQFSSQLTKSKAEKFSLHILQAFESVLRSPVTIELRCESRKGFGAGPILLPAAQYPSTSDPTRNRDDVNRLQIRDASSSAKNRREIVEIEASPKVEHKDDKVDSDRVTSTQKISTMFGERNQNLSIVKSKVSLAQVIQHAEGSSQHSGWSRRKAVSIAEKLEQENLRLEPSSRRLLCWNPPKVTRRKLDLSYNNLSGPIPKSFETLKHLDSFNVSVNALSGEIPTGGPFGKFTIEPFKANKALCGIPRFHVPLCRIASNHTSRRKKVEFALFGLAGVVVLISVVSLAFLFIRCKRKGKIAGKIDEQIHSAVPERISYYEILLSTEHFNENNLIGIGSFGSVYRGMLRDGKVIAVKVFNLQNEAAFTSFEVECEVLRNIRHRNLTKVISSCSNKDFKAIVLEYMPNGNLEKWLYSHNYCLDVKQRLNIMIDVASALEYLHHGYSTPIVHCDLKPSNVLLDEDMVAHVCDFGIAKLLDDGESVLLTSTLATLGYIAPEYGLEGQVSTRCDVYSYGVMLMEIFTRKRPSDDTFGGDLSLKNWVESLLQQSPHEVIDSNLLHPDNEHLNNVLQCISAVLELALKCCAESPRSRIDMKEALSALHKIKRRFRL